MTQPQGTQMTRSGAVERLATTPRLFVACDYDGTIAPIVDDPARALPDRRAVIALRALSQLPHTEVAVISGRRLDDLAGFMPGLEGVHMVGSHGSEFDAGFADQLSQDKRELLRVVRNELREIAATGEGLMTEEKPASVALHMRTADPAVARRALERVEAGPALAEGITVKRGKQVIELCVIETDKGKAMQYMRERASATACVFIGDDATDEDAFRSMHGPDLSIKVGPGDTHAQMRLRDPVDVARFLASLVHARSRWITGSACVPIEQHAMLSDHRTIALVTPGADITWLCAPRIDSPAIFADLLGGPGAGHWSVGPADGSLPIDQGYTDATMTLSTSFETMRVLDYLDCSGGRPTQKPGRMDLIRVVEGGGPLRTEFAPRLSFGQIPTHIEHRDEGLLITGSHDQIVLHAPRVRWEIAEQGNHHTAVGHADLDEGPVIMELRFGTHHPEPIRTEEIVRRVQTQAHWSSWADALGLPGLHDELIRRSALVLRALCYGPSGAIAAAGTTSLPERVGGVRNWDYRYCWPRDAAMAASALARLGSVGEGMALLDWLKGVLDTLPSPDALAPLYTVSGEALGPEAEIAELSGYAGSRPVRVGNAAAYQIQLDVFGPILDLIALLAERGAPLCGWHWRMAQALGRVVAQRWSEPDHGIWEPRIAPRHHVHSKTMCWLSLDRLRRIGAIMHEQDHDQHDPLMGTIRDEILEKGWNAQLGAFTDAYGSRSPDAATLWTGLSGMLAPDDERFVSNVEVVDRELRDGSAVYRYFHDDGLPGDEGGFNLCTAWLIESLALTGRTQKAHELFDRYAALAGQTGLFSEEHDPRTGQALGNVPQAYSHLGLINAALSLSQPERSEIPTPARADAGPGANPMLSADRAPAGAVPRPVPPDA